MSDVVIPLVRAPRVKTGGTQPDTINEPDVAAVAAVVPPAPLDAPRDMKNFPVATKGVVSADVLADIIEGKRSLDELKAPGSDDDFMTQLARAGAISDAARKQDAQERQASAPAPSSNPATDTLAPAALPGEPKPGEQAAEPVYVDDSHRDAIETLTATQMDACEKLDLSTRQAQAKLDILRGVSPADTAAHLAAQQPGGGASGPGGLAAGLGSGLSAIGRGIGKVLGAGASGATSLANRGQIKEIEKTLKQNATRKAMLFGPQFDQTIAAANDMFTTRAALNDRVKGFNERFANSTQGGEFLQALSKHAETKMGGDTAENITSLREMIHTSGVTDPDVLALRRQAGELSTHADFADDMDFMRTSTRKLGTSTVRFGDGIEQLERNGVAVEDADKLKSAFDGFDVENSKLSPPGERFDSMKENFEAMIKRIREFAERLVASMRALFSGGRRP